MIIINLGLVKWEGPAGLGNESKRVRVKTGHFRKAGQCGSSTKTHQHGLECSIFSFQLLKPVVKKSQECVCFGICFLDCMVLVSGPRLMGYI